MADHARALWFGLALVLAMVLYSWLGSGVLLHSGGNPALRDQETCRHILRCDVYHLAARRILPCLCLLGCRTGLRAHVRSQAGLTFRSASSGARKQSWGRAGRADATLSRQRRAQ